MAFPSTEESTHVWVSLLDTQHEDSEAQALEFAALGQVSTAGPWLDVEKMLPPLGFPVMSDARAILAKNNSEKKELLNHY